LQTFNATLLVLYHTHSHSFCVTIMQLTTILNKIEETTQQYGRLPHSVKLLAVSKKQSIQQIEAAYTIGQRNFGESYLQEALQKIASLNSTHLHYCWHFIGPIQSNKTAKIAQNFDWVHSVDRLKIAQRLNEQRSSDQAALNVCIQVNISRENSKAGIDQSQVSELAQSIQEMPRLKLRGLMAMPAPHTEFTQQQQAFKKMKHLFNLLRQQGFELDTLSMGTSQDWQAAISEGSTIIRLGTVLFGNRQ